MTHSTAAEIAHIAAALARVRVVFIVDTSFSVHGCGRLRYKREIKGSLLHIEEKALKLQVELMAKIIEFQKYYCVCVKSSEISDSITYSEVKR